MSQQELLVQVLLGAVLGMVGQGARVVVGIKKGYVQARDDGKSFTKDVFEPAQLLLSMLIGAVAGVLGILAYTGLAKPDNDKLHDLAFTIIAVGYAGTDFIEGFVKKYVPQGNDGPTPPIAPPQPND